jgi:hypothetical protein
MGITILDTATATNVYAAADQDSQILALIAPWSGGNVIARFMAGASLLSTVTFGPWSKNKNVTPRQLTLGARVSRTFTSTGALNKIVFRVGTTDIFEIDAGVGSGSVSMAGSIVSTSAENLAAMVLTALNTLPAIPQPPDWATGLAVNAAVAIPNSVLAGSPVDPTGDPGDINSYAANALAYGNFAQWGNYAIIAAGGGHNNGGKNPVGSIRVTDDTADIGWAALKDNSWDGGEADVAYYALGTPAGYPASRHLYDSVHYSTQKARLMLHRSRVVYGGLAASFDASNGFNLVNNTWDPAGTHADGKTPCCKAQDSDYVFAITSEKQLWRWNSTTDVWSTLGSAAATDGPITPVCHSASRNELFGISWGSGESGSGIRARSWVASTGAYTDIGIAASAAYTQFIADCTTDFDPGGPQEYGGAYGSMEWVDQLGKYVYWDGASRRLYTITPNVNPLAWVMAQITLTGATIPVRSYTFGRMKVYTDLNGIVVWPGGNDSMYLIKLWS